MPSPDGRSPSATTCTPIRSCPTCTADMDLLSLTCYLIEFKGESAHAVAGPWKARSALATAMAPIMAGLAGVKVEKWWKFVVPVFLCLFVTQAVLMVVAVVTGFGA